MQYDFIFPSLSEHDLENANISSRDTVRIAASFDMGWTTRGTGRTYDSLSGTAALIGFFTKKVISYVTLNRKCKMCDLASSRECPVKEHDCRLNFAGSAKAMEPKAAVELINNNPILMEANLEIGIIIADNDSSSICAVRNAINYEIIKQADKNHTSKGVVNELYKLKRNYKELTGTAIKYLQRCFNYSVSQNENNSIAMAKSIQNIPYHCFNQHQNCGAWCNFHMNPDTYSHSTIGDGFKNEKLFDALKCLFNTLASKTNRFAAGASSNPNESLNAMIVSKAPKSRMYGMSASGDMRTACAMNKKNDGESFIVDVHKNCTVSPGKHTAKFSTKMDKFAKKRYEKSLTSNFKRRRLDLKKQKTELRNKQEILEGITYETDVGLLETLDVPITIANVDKNLQSIIVLFDLETGSFHKTADILQIAARHKNSNFSVYIEPRQKISDEASQINGLRCINGHLEFNGKVVVTVSLSEAMRAFYQFLCIFGRKCILTAHNCKFDQSRLMRSIEQLFMMEQFESIIEGFSDTLPIIRKCTGRKGKGSNKLGSIADDLQISTDQAHNAIYDVEMLDQVLCKLNITSQQLIECAISWSKIQENKIFLEKLPNALKELNSLNECTTLSTRKKIIVAGITFDMILNAYNQNKLMGLLDILGEDENGIVRVTKNRKIATKIGCYLEKLPNEVAKD